MRMRNHPFAVAAILLFLAAALGLPGKASAHCDTMDGPVVSAARIALEKGDVTPVLKWIRPEDEKEIRAAFDLTIEVRGAGPKARQLADLWFFETLVRIHRAGEGAPYTGLAPAGTPIEPSIALADKALATGDPTDLVRFLGGAVAAGTRERFARAAEAQQHADESVAKGRGFVAAYVELTHYVERLHADATLAAAHGHGETGAAPAHEH